MEYLTPTMDPGPGERLLRFVGDRVRFSIRDSNGRPPVPGWKAFLRTNLGRARELRQEILLAHTRGVPPAGHSWRDVPMHQVKGGWEVELLVAETGFFRAKPYVVDQRGWQHWPHGPDIGVSVHPNTYRTSNTIYCAFVRMFGATKSAKSTCHAATEAMVQPLDAAGYTVIPPSGKLRELVAELPHIVNKLGCRILHLLPVHPTPTTFARFGRYGSPYAALDLTAIDPALVEFDRQSTGIDQFRELTYAAHRLGARVILDIVINHTGWGSVLQEQHPEWFLREGSGRFTSPGAWGTTWEDLVELRHDNIRLWDELAEMFLTWCRRGVDGYRCDAGYKVPVAAWQYIIHRVQQEYPDTLFLLEGLGGAWEATEALLTDGGMQWAYSELFQNYTGAEVASYLAHSVRQSSKVGVLVHYSETHDNARLAAKGKAWSLLRNRLCALTSVNGGFGFTCGVEWLASEKILVHGSSGLNWGASDNVVEELATLNRVLCTHPCFFDGAILNACSPPGSPVYALHRLSADKADRVLVLVNTDVEHARELSLEPQPGVDFAGVTLPAWVDLLGQSGPVVSRTHETWKVSLGPSSVYCLSPVKQPQGTSGESYRNARSLAAWGFQALSALLPVEALGPLDWRAIAHAVASSPSAFLTAVSEASREMSSSAPPFTLSEEAFRRLFARAGERQLFDTVVRWNLADCRRVTPVPPGHWLILEDDQPFRAALTSKGNIPVNVESVQNGALHYACFAPSNPGDATLLLERYGRGEQNVRAAIRFLSDSPVIPDDEFIPSAQLMRQDIVLLTNNRGGMARICIDLGHVTSKYDCVLGANLHPTLPVDRHIFVKRIRVWVNADGFISPLDFQSMSSFAFGPPARWRFRANAGDGRSVEIDLEAGMLPGQNAVRLVFSRPAAQNSGKALPANADVRLTVRPDIEDRSYHCETKRNSGAEFHFTSNTHQIQGARPGFSFTPAPDRQMRATASGGTYHPQPEWSVDIAHSVEQTRGQVGAGDAFSPGWFELPLPAGAAVDLTMTAEPDGSHPISNERTPAAPCQDDPDRFASLLRRATGAFLAKREDGFTVIAGYPWFLDWGRDTFIAARGLLAMGMHDEVLQMLLTFARFEERGTLPNTIFGPDASNRDTSDAPLWFGVVCEELSRLAGPEVLRTRIRRGDDTLLDTIRSIARGYVHGTPNGIKMDPESGLIWSPSHFTWMDTNYPACTPRQGYPIEIQALWIRFLKLLQAEHGGASEVDEWAALHSRALRSLDLFWCDERGYYADVLLAEKGQPARTAVIDDALRSNCLFPLAFGIVFGDRARRCVEAVRRHLVIPGALRSLPPLPVSVPLPNRGPGGHMLNDPLRPYWGRYEGDEDTRRKPAYHNGTGWTWTLPSFSEALARAWNFSPEAVTAARSYLAGMDRLLMTGCLGQLPEIVDGDAPHQQRGCDAQAWASTEAYRVWSLLNSRK